MFLRLQELGCNPTTPVSNFPTAQGLQSVSASNIIAITRAETQRLGAPRIGFSPEDVRTHSIRSGGAMAMHITWVPCRKFIAIGQWCLLGFMVYIQQQILSFSAGVSKNERTNSVPAFLSNQLSTDPTQHIFHSSPSQDPSVEPSNILVQTARPHLHPVQ